MHKVATPTCAKSSVGIAVPMQGGSAELHAFVKAVQCHSPQNTQFIDVQLTFCVQTVSTIQIFFWGNNMYVWEIYLNFVVGGNQQIPEQENNSTIFRFYRDRFSNF